MLYDDGRIACDDRQLIIRRYYPWGSAKRIAYGKIRSVTRWPMTGVTSGKWRIWGSGDFVHWWNLDPTRPRKSVAMEIDVGGCIVPTISPDDPEAVDRILSERTRGASQQG